jgi:hypothetical protein
MFKWIKRFPGKQNWSTLNSFQHRLSRKNGTRFFSERRKYIFEHQFSLRYGDEWSQWHGREVGNLMIVRLKSDEVIDGVQLWASSNGIHSIQFMTNYQSLFGPFGGQGVNYTNILWAAFSNERVFAQLFFVLSVWLFNFFLGTKVALKILVQLNIGGNHVISLKQRCALTYISGASGEILDSLTLHYVCPHQNEGNPSMESLP